MVKLKYNETSQKWEELPKGSKEGMYMDGYLYHNLKQIKDFVSQDADALILVDGMERSGKSTLALQIAKFLDPTFNESRIVFFPEDFKKVIKASSKQQAVVWDEAITGARAARWATEMSQGVVELLGQVGQKNLFLIMCMPSFFEFHKYIALHRSLALVHVRWSDGKRGYFDYYSYEKKRTLYTKGRTEMNYRATYPNFYGRFTGGYVIDEETYRGMKARALDAELIEKTPPMHLRWKKQRNAFLLWFKQNGYSNEKINKILDERRIGGVEKSVIAKILREASGNGGVSSPLLTPDPSKKGLSGLEAPKKKEYIKEEDG